MNSNMKTLVKKYLAKQIKYACAFKFVSIKTVLIIQSSAFAYRNCKEEAFNAEALADKKRK